MAKSKSTRSKKAVSLSRHKAVPVFVLYESNLPVAGLPPPLPCPFCGCLDIKINLKRDKLPDLTSYWRANCWCEGCGCESGETTTRDEGVTDSASPVISLQYGLVMTAARRWNRRNGRGAS